MAPTNQGSVVPRFEVGDNVWVKLGVSDPDFPDMPLGGWSGTVTEVVQQEGQIYCVFELDERTLASLHPIDKQRCEIDGLDCEVLGFGQEALFHHFGLPRHILVEPSEWLPITASQ